MSELAAVASAPGAETAQALSVSHLSKRFGDRVAFDDLTFDVARGEVFGWRVVSALFDRERLLPGSG